MERGEKQSTSSSQTSKIEPTFVPEWLKTMTTVIGGGGSSNHISGSSSHSDDHAAGILSRSRLPVNTCKLDNHRSSLITERSSLSYCRSSSTNGSLTHDKDNSLLSRPHSSFGRSNRDKGREKDIDFRDRKEPIKLENGFHDFPDSFISSRSEKDTMRRSQSMISGRRSDSWPKRTGNGTANFLSTGSIVTTISKASFDREFPSLGAEDKQGPPEIGRVSSPGLSSANQSPPLGSSALIGGDGWTSALAEVPVILGGNGPPFSPVQPAVPTSTVSVVSSTMTGLNMAETLAQTPSQARAAPQISVDSQKLKELVIKQSRQLIPMTPSMPKTLVLNSSEKLKPKGSRSGDFGTSPKVVGQQPSPQLNHTLHGSSRPDISKPSQVGNFQVLNRERNGISPTARDGPSTTNAAGVLNPLGVVSAAATAPPLKTPNILKLRVDGKATTLPVTTYMEKRPVTKQNRSEFFNSLRKKASLNHTASIPATSSCQMSSLGKSDEQNTGTSTSLYVEMKDTSVSDSGLDCSMGESNSARPLDVRKDSEDSHLSNGYKSSCLDPAEEERLLRLFGWKENAGEEEALTAEEIDAFIEEYQKLRPSSKFSRRNLLLANTALLETGDGSCSGSSSSHSKTEGI